MKLFYKRSLNSKAVSNVSIRKTFVQGIKHGPSGKTGASFTLSTFSASDSSAAAPTKNKRKTKTCT